MIVLNATPELRLTFEKLIRTMEVKVKWNGLFIIIDNTLILQGDVRSLFFHFDSRKVVTNIIDLEIPVQKITPIANNDYVKNVINMLLYAFGKWGNIKGLTVEKDYCQLSQLFANILGEMEIEPEYNKEHFWFYQKGVRIVYEEVVQCAIDSKEREPEMEEEEHTGLWHKLIWQQIYEDFSVQETTAKERSRNRLGNNFYLTSYVCPVCRNKMHGVIYPAGKEFVIDTKEGRVQIARAYTCGKCCSFYTPRPKRLLIDGDCYIMDFGGDKAAYQDYQELLGKKGDKVCNPNYNKYLDKRASAGRGSLPNAVNQKITEEESLEELQEMLEEIDDLSNREFDNFFAKVAEGFFPEKVVDPVEKALWKKHEARERGEKTTGGIKGYERKEKKKEDDTSEREKDLTDKNVLKKGREAESTEQKLIQEKTARYEKRLELFPRLSDRQRSELVKQISVDVTIPEETKRKLLESAKELKRQENYQRLKERAESAKKKNPIVMLRLYGEIQEAELNEPERKKLFKLTGLTEKDYRAYLAEKEESESRADRDGNLPVKKYSVRDGSSPAGVRDTGKNDASAETYNGRKSNLSEEAGNSRGRGFFAKNSNERGREKTLEGYNSQKEDGLEKDYSSRNRADRSAVNRAADIREIEAMIRQTKSTSREDLQQLWENLQAQDFDKEVLEPYEEHVKAQIQRLDEAYLDSLLEDITDLSSDEGVEVYEEIKEANILPELKANALKQLEKRLSKVKAEECELLMQKLQKEMKEANVAEPDRHHYYPARQVLMKEIPEKQVEVVHYAKAAYGAGIGPFEYPIWTVDTSRNHSGDKGMFLTPEYLYYSTLTTSYRISVFAIDHVDALNGLLNRGLYIYQKNGEKTKLPYAVEVSELPKLAGVLDTFIKYLQEKPFSRKEVYLAKEKHDEICCFRCGYVYRRKNTCPKCGYKANQ